MVRAVGVLLAVTAVLATTAASASAEAPEFGRCVKMAGGLYGNSHCTGPTGGGRYEWEPGPGARTGFTVHASTLQLTLQGNERQGCKPVNATGEITGPKTVGDVVFTMQCEESRFDCETVVTAPMRGELGVYALGATPAQDRIGLKLEAEVGDEWAEFDCFAPPSPFVWTGGFVIGQMKANRMSSSQGLLFKAKHLRNEFAVEQQPMSFVGGAPDQPEGTLSNGTSGDEKIQQKLGWTMRSKLFAEESIEVSSVL